MKRELVFEFLEQVKEKISVDISSLSRFGFPQEDIECLEKAAAMRGGSANKVSVAETLVMLCFRSGAWKSPAEGFAIRSKSIKVRCQIMRAAIVAALDTV